MKIILNLNLLVITLLIIIKRLLNISVTLWLKKNNKNKLKNNKWNVENKIKKIKLKK